MKNILGNYRPMRASCTPACIGGQYCREGLCMKNRCRNTRQYIILNNGILKSNSSIFPRRGGVYYTVHSLQTCKRALCPLATQGEKCRERCCREAITYLARCRRCRDRQTEEGVSDEDILDKAYIGEPQVNSDEE